MSSFYIAQKERHLEQNLSFPMSSLYIAQKETRLEQNLSNGNTIDKNITPDFSQVK